MFFLTAVGLILPAVWEMSGSAVWAAHQLELERGLLAQLQTSSRILVRATPKQALPELSRWRNEFSRELIISMGKQGKEKNH